MDATIQNWLSSVGTQAFAWSLVAFLVINGTAAAAFLLHRDRSWVNRWTGRILAADILLLGTGVGVPLVAGLTRLTVTAVTTSMTGIAGEAKADASNSASSVLMPVTR